MKKKRKRFEMRIKITSETTAVLACHFNSHGYHANAGKSRE
jgi:hypothetical protein